jgi:ABC-type transport system substrate-binding protein
MEGTQGNERGFKGAEEGATFEDGGYDMHGPGSYGLGASNLDPDQLSLTLSSLARWPGGWNWWNWANVDVDQGFDEGRNTLDREERYAIYGEVQKVLAEELPIIPIAFELQPWTMSSKLENVEINLISGWRVDSDIINFKGEEGGEFRTAYTSDPVKLLPWWGNIGSALFATDVWETLLTNDGNFEPKPELADSWEITDDGYTYTFYLNENVLWHDGEPFNADDVVYTFEGLAIKETGTTIHSRIVQNVESVEKIDDYTVRFRMVTQNPGAMSAVFMSTIIIPEHIMGQEAYADWRTADISNVHPIGTGPMKFVEWAPEEYVELEKNPEYYRDTTPFDRRINIAIPDSSTALAALKTGEVDMLIGHSLDATQLEEIKADPDIQVLQKLRVAPFILGINLEHPVLNNKYVRKAISAAIPREQFANDVLQGLAIPATSILNELTWVWDESITVPLYDLDQAKEYMEMAGYHFADLEPEPPTPISQNLIYVVAGLVIGLAIGFGSKYLMK